MLGVSTGDPSSLEIAFSELHRFTLGNAEALLIVRGEVAREIDNLAHVIGHMRVIPVKSLYYEKCVAANTDRSISYGLQASIEPSAIVRISYPPNSIDSLASLANIPVAGG